MKLGNIILDSSWIQFLTQQQQQQPGMPGQEGMPGQDQGAQDQGAQDQMAADVGQDAGAAQGQEPDYENMSLDELQQELDKLQAPKAEQPAGLTKSEKRFFKELEL